MFEYECSPYLHEPNDSVGPGWGQVNLSEAPGDPAGDNEPEGRITALTRVDAVLALC